MNVYEIGSLSEKLSINTYLKDALSDGIEF